MKRRREAYSYHLELCAKLCCCICGAIIVFSCQIVDTTRRGTRGEIAEGITSASHTSRDIQLPRSFPSLAAGVLWNYLSRILSYLISTLFSSAFSTRTVNAVGNGDIQHRRRPATATGSRWTGQAAAPRILGGAKVQDRTVVPWMARFLECSRLKCKLACGGALITTTHVLTAAQCFYLPDLPSAPRNLSLVLGDLNTYFKEFTEQERKFTTTVYPDYTSTSTQVKMDDVGIAKLKGQAVSTGPKVGVISLAAAAPGEGAVVTVFGWGLSSVFNYPGATSPYLNSATLTVRNFDECNAKWNDSLTADSQFCASDTSMSACTSDVGGPAVVQNDDGSLSLVGIISFFYENPSKLKIFDRCPVGVKPNVMTSVAAYADWINNITSA